MRGTILPEEDYSSPDYTNTVIIGGVVFVLLIILHRFFLSRKPDYGRVVTILKDEKGIEAEDAGETNNSYMFSISISALTQHFDLNEFVEKMHRLGCNVLSTADTNNPSFRTLTVEVPKTRGGIGLMTILFFGFFVGMGYLYVYQGSMVYNLFKDVSSIVQQNV